MKNKKMIYVLLGHTGKYEDSHCWRIAVYYDKEEAEKHLLKCEEFVSKEINPRAEDEYTELEKTVKNPYDPGMYVDYTGVDYFVEEGVIYENGFEGFIKGE